MCNCMSLSCYVVFQSHSTYFSCLNIKQILSRNRLNIWNWSDSNGIRIHDYLVCKRTFNHLAKLTKRLPVWLNIWLFVYELSSCGFESRCCHLNICLTWWYIYNPQLMFYTTRSITHANQQKLNKEKTTREFKSK